MIEMTYEWYVTYADGKTEYPITADTAQQVLDALIRPEDVIKLERVKQVKAWEY